MAAYQNSQEAQQDLTTTFGPTNDAQKAAISNAAALVPGATSTPSPSYPRYTQDSAAENYLGEFKAPQSEEAISARKSQAAQGEIDSLNRHYDGLLAEQKVINEGRDRSTASVNTLTGLSGSTEANVQANQTTAVNQKDNQKIQAERSMAVQNVLGQVRASAVEEARQSRMEARQSAEDVMAIRTKRQTEATTQLTNLSKSGVTADGLKATDPQSYDYLVRSLGGEAQVKAAFTLNRPVETIFDKKIENGKYVIAWQNPLDGKIRIETLDLGLPPQYTEQADLGDRFMFYEKGNPDNYKFVYKGLTPSQSGSGGSGGGLKETAGERNALGFYVRGKDALESIDSVEDKVTGTLQSQGALQYLPNLFQSGDQQIYRQLQRQFTEARLRKESGAAIPTSEFDSDSKTYFAQPGDTFETLARKKAARVKVLESLKISSGNAYKNYANDPGNASTSLPESRILIDLQGNPVDASDLNEDEYQQAVADGYQPQ